jgi:hypothetical protein
MYPETPLEGQARLLERQRGNEFSLYQKVNLQREENQDLVRQNMAHVANEEAMKKHALMQSMKIDELNSIIQRQQREIASLKKDNSEVSHIFQFKKTIFSHFLWFLESSSKRLWTKKFMGKLKRFLQILNGRLLLFQTPSSKRSPKKYLSWPTNSKKNTL